MLTFYFTNETDREVSREIFERVFERGSGVLKEKIGNLCGEGMFSLVLVTDERIQGLNREYRKKDESTDVLSFAYNDSKVVRSRSCWSVGTPHTAGGAPCLLGDIFISIDTAKRQAKKRGHSLKKELEILFVHGFLHLFGFDHRTDKEEVEMEKWASKILA